MNSLKRALKHVLSTTDVNADVTATSNKRSKKTDGSVEENANEDIMTEVFNTVLSQRDGGVTVADDNIDADIDSDMSCGADHCRLHNDVRRLLHIIQLQSETIKSLDIKLNAVLKYVGLDSSALQTEEPTFTQSRDSKKTQRQSTQPDRNGRTWTRNPAGRDGPSADVGRTRNNADLGEVQTRLIVHRTLNDESRRKRNVIITGVPEDPSVDDKVAFSDLCETFFSGQTSSILVCSYWQEVTRQTSSSVSPT